MRISKKIRERLMRGAKKFAKRSVRAGVNLKKFRSDDYANALSAVVSGGGGVSVAASAPSSAAPVATPGSLVAQLRAEIARLKKEKMDFLTKKRTGPFVPAATIGDDVVLSKVEFKRLETHVRETNALKFEIQQLNELIEKLKFNLQKEQEAGDARKAEGTDYIDQIEQLTKDLQASENDAKKVEILQRALTETRKLLQDARLEADEFSRKNANLKEELAACKDARVDLTRWKALTSQTCGESLKAFGSEDILQKAYERYENLTKAGDNEAMPKAAQHAATLAAEALNLIKIASRNTQTNNIAKQLGWDGNGNSADFVDTEIQRLKTMENASAPPGEAKTYSPEAFKKTSRQGPFAPGAPSAPSPLPTLNPKTISRPRPPTDSRDVTDLVNKYGEKQVREALQTRGWDDLTKDKDGWRATYTAPAPNVGLSPLSPNAQPSAPPQTGGGGGFFSNIFGSASAAPSAPPAPAPAPSAPKPEPPAYVAANVPVSPPPQKEVTFADKDVPRSGSPCKFEIVQKGKKLRVYFDHQCQNEAEQYIEEKSYEKDGGEVKTEKGRKYFIVRKKGNKEYLDSGFFGDEFDYGYESDPSIDMPLMSTWGDN